MTKHDTANPGRRSMLGLAVGLTAATLATVTITVQSASAAGKADKLDTELLELGQHFDAQWDCYLSACELDPEYVGHVRTNELDRLGEIADAVRHTVPASFAGMLVWLKVLAFEAGFLRRMNPDPDDDTLELDHTTFLLLYRQVERLAREEVRA